MNLRRHAADERDAVPLWVRHGIALPFLAALICGALICAIAFVAGERSRDTTKAAAQAIVRSNRDASIRALIRETDEYKRDVVTLAETSSIQNFLDGGGAASRDAVDDLSVLTRSKESPAAFLVDTNGRNNLAYPSNPAAIGKNFSFRDWFKGVSQSGTPYVSEGFRSAAIGQPLAVAIASPVFKGGRRLGYVVILWQLDSLRILSQGALKDDGVGIQVTDQSGQSLLDPLKVDSRGQPLPLHVSAATKRALAGHKSSIDTGGTLLEAAPVSGIGWTVSASLPTRVAMAPYEDFKHRRMINVGAALATILLLAIGASLLARRRSIELEAGFSDRRQRHVSDERFRRVFDEGLTGKILADAEGTVLRVNWTLTRLLGAGGPELLGRPLVSFFTEEKDRVRILSVIESGETELRGEMAIRGATDVEIWGLVSLTWITEGDDQKVMLVQVEDVTARRVAEQRLTDLALLDELTGLPNRRLLVERFERAFAVARSGRVGGGGTVAALFVDLDGFKKINDWAGHDVGDKLLVSVATDVQAVLRPTDTIARIGGDEFVVLIEQDEGIEHLTMVAERIMAAVRREIVSDGQALTVSASVGIARVDLSAEPGVDADQLIRRADAAMYRAKERGRDRYDVFDRSLRASTESRQALEVAVREGLQHDRIGLIFQPVIDVDRGTVLGAEALMRLVDAQGRVLPTLPAIIAAETAGLAEALGERIINLALAEASNWPEHMTIAVNVSARELTGRSLRVRVEQALKKHGIAASRLILEITETSILRAGPSALAELERLRGQGVSVAIDDFGTGYATLQNLITLPVDALKVDTSFTAGLPHLRTHSAIVRGIVSMADALDIPCIIEGVENEQQLAAIRGMGVHAQGWLLAESRGPGHVPEMLAGTPH